MDDKDRRVLRKLQEHTEAVLRYCKDCAGSWKRPIGRIDDED